MSFWANVFWANVVWANVVSPFSTQLSTKSAKLESRPRRIENVFEKAKTFLEGTFVDQYLRCIYWLSLLCSLHMQLDEKFLSAAP
jgi:hypothetical protein